jgi:large subunit ribosomal protein L18
MNKKESRATKSRKRIREVEAIRLCIHRTPRHIYAQIISIDGNKTIASASTVEKELKEQLKYTGNLEAATSVGKLVAARAIKAGIQKVAFDRSGFQYHGRVKALADAARESGLEF